MTDKVQRIRQEIEKRLKCLEKIKLRRELAAAEIGDIACCKYLLSFIDSLQEEPVSEDLEKAAVEAFKQIVDENRNSFLEIFKAGAQWKIAKLMKDATEVTVHIEAGNYPYIPQIELYDYNKDVPLAKEGDKYKVVLIKES